MSAESIWTVTKKQVRYLSEQLLWQLLQHSVKPKSDLHWIAVVATTMPYPQYQRSSFPHLDPTHRLQSCLGGKCINRGSRVAPIPVPGTRTINKMIAFMALSPNTERIELKELDVLCLFIRILRIFRWTLGKRLLLYELIGLGIVQGNVRHILVRYC